MSAIGSRMTQVCIPQICKFKIGEIKVRMIQVGPFQICIRQVHLAQIRILQRVGIYCRKQVSVYVLYLYHFKSKGTNIFESTKFIPFRCPSLGWLKVVFLR